ncbi:hypothetical protein pb186bvf_016015 [Paramecium bursaria]
MFSLQTTSIRNSPSRYTSWSDLKKGIREKVTSKVSGFDNQKIIKKSEVLYNFKQNESESSYLHKNLSNYNLSAVRSSGGLPQTRGFLQTAQQSKSNLQDSNLQLRTSTAYIRNALDGRFPRQESPIRQGLTRSIYSPPKLQTYPERKPISFDYDRKYPELESKKPFETEKRQLFNIMPRTKTLNERVSVSEIIRISSHLSDIQTRDIPQLPSGYLQELVTLQSNIQRILKNTSQKLYK